LRAINYNKIDNKNRDDSIYLKICSEISNFAADLHRFSLIKNYLFYLS